IALSGIPGDWVARHRGLIPPSDEIVSLTEAGADELGTLNAWLETRVGAPRLARGKMVFHQLGCLGCHRRGDVGGDIGPDLTWVGDKDVREVSGEAAGSGTLAAWVLQHLREPQALDPDSNMPPLDEEELDRESDLDDLVTYLLSLRGEAISPPFAPPDRARVRFGLGRDVPTTGRGLYVTFCAACHGFYATGAELETLGLVTPMIGIRGYLSTVSARYLVDSIQRGRRGRYMPAWGPEDGGLAPAEIDAIVEYLLDRGFKVKPFGSLSGVPDPENGREVFARRCVACHASGSDDTPRFGRDLLAAGALRHFPRPVLYEAVMRGWVEEGMPSFAFLKPADARDLIAHLMPKTESRALPGVAHDGLHSNFGHQVWKAKCLECHGTEGEGGEGPMLNTEPYLEWAIDPYLAARTRDHQGRVARATVGPISDGDLDAILDYMRSWSGRVGPAAALTPDPAAVARGKELYAPRCTECHAEGGRGSTGPALANRDFLDLVSRPFIVMSILEGRKGTAMAPWRTRTEFPLGIEDAFDLADYILSLGWSGERPSNASSTEESDANHGG
ncbi:MAG: c-type cytochrome, partial [Thermoanaerobaculia bacterium]